MHFRYGKTFCRLAQECEENMLVKLSSDQSRKAIDRPIRFLPPKMVPDKANMRLQHTLNKYKRSKDFKGMLIVFYFYKHTEYSLKMNISGLMNRVIPYVKYTIYLHFHSFSSASSQLFGFNDPSFQLQLYLIFSRFHINNHHFYIYLNHIFLMSTLLSFIEATFKLFFSYFINDTYFYANLMIQLFNDNLILMTKS